MKQWINQTVLVKIYYSLVIMSPTEKAIKTINRNKTCWQCKFSVKDDVQTLWQSQTFSACTECDVPSALFYSNTLITNVYIIM